MEKIKGLIAAPFTPFKTDGSLNLDMIERQAELFTTNNLKGVFVGGTTGESMSLTIKERMAIAERWIEVSPENFKVIIHTGHTSLSDCKTIAQHAQKIGAYATGAIGPLYYKLNTVEDLVLFTGEIAGAAPELPFYYYHFPSMTGIYFPMVDYLEAAREHIPNLAGIKFTHEDLMDFKLCNELDNSRFELLFGRDEILLCGLALGALGAVGSTYNYMAPLYNQIMEAWHTKQLEQAGQLQYKAMQFVRILHKYGGGIICGKALMKITGIDCGPVRSPLKNLTDEELTHLYKELEKIGYFEFAINEV